MSGIRYVLDSECRRWILYPDIHFIEENMVCTNTGTDCSAEMRIAFKRKIKHKIEVERPWQSLGLYRIRLIVPTSITKLNQEMIIGTVGKIELLLLFWWCNLR